MVEGLSRKGDDDPSKRITLDQATIHNKELHDFVTENTRKFFHILSLPDSFLEIDPDNWITNPDYLEAEDVIRELRVVNDTAERVALMQEHNSLLTKNKEQTQFALQVVHPPLTIEK